ncbi:uncharacterized protein BX664DRAFT_321508 [Halteromyces radiatus]|uniref:uncharacterized protein n=1 Tax=Halteromyces radiatus TaxID=101107 RepID=UPI00222078FE|nr:uncharacterized protein BX664DRAFT_321508 [Halteromyces radiatus]KAI8099524.1 hypothetical protein BX664DRAFT_321508 [Halteromyces radiatus]
MKPTLLVLSKAPAVPRFFKDNHMSLNHFLLRGQVISLYRKFMRCTKGMNKNDATELRQWIRTDFERYRHEHDLDKIKNLITAGQHQMHTLQGSVSMAQTGRHQ